MLFSLNEIVFSRHAKDVSCGSLRGWRARHSGGRSFNERLKESKKRNGLLLDGLSLGRCGYPPRGPRRLSYLG